MLRKFPNRDCCVVWTCDPLFSCQSDGLSWRNCRGGEEPVTLKNMTVQPDPIKIPGQILLEGTAYVAESLTLLKVKNN